MALAQLPVRTRHRLTGHTPLHAGYGVFMRTIFMPRVLPCVSRGRYSVHLQYRKVLQMLADSQGEFIPRRLPK